MGHLRETQMNSKKGFTLLELIMVIVLLSILSLGVAMLWPKGMKEEADHVHIIHALRLTQHIAMTRPYDNAHPWGFVVGPGGSSYSIKKKGTTTYAKDPSSGKDMKDIALMGKSPLVCDKQGIWFDRLGTPLDYSLLSAITTEFHCTIGGRTITIHPETGYVE